VAARRPAASAGRKQSKARAVQVERGWLDRRQLADAMRVHVSAIPRWQDAGMPVARRGGRGVASLYDLEDCEAWRRARAGSVLGKETAGETDGAELGRLDPAQERARRDRAQTRLVELQIAAKRQELLPADDVRRVWSAEQARIRARLLGLWRTESARLARAHTRGGEPAVVVELKAIGREVLEELAEPLDEIVAGAADGDPVGADDSDQQQQGKRESCTTS